MRIAIHQPNFLPWIGFFHKISLADSFVLLDDVQLERGKSFTQRVKILVNGEEKWLTIPIVNKSDLTLIKDAQVEDSPVWKKKLVKTIELNYKNSLGFDELFPQITRIFSIESRFLIDYNVPLILELAGYLNLKATVLLSSEISDSTLHGAEKILSINKVLNATTYISGKGSGSMRYINPEDYKNSGINLEWQEFVHKEYKQLRTSKFIPGMSVIDLCFNCGRQACQYL